MRPGRRQQGTLDAEGHGRRRVQAEVLRLVEWGTDIRRRRPGRPRLRAIAAGLGRGVGVSADECPGAGPLPDGRGVLRRAGPGDRRGRRRARRQHPPLRHPPRRRAAASCPSTRSSCSTRPTSSRRSSRRPRHRDRHRPLRRRGPDRPGHPRRTGRARRGGGRRHRPRRRARRPQRQAGDVRAEVGRGARARPGSGSRSSARRFGKIETGDPDATSRKARAQGALAGLMTDLDWVLELREGDVAWVEGPPGGAGAQGHAGRRRPSRSPSLFEDTPPSSPRPPCPPGSSTATRDAGRAHRRARRRQPVRLRGQRPPLLRRPPPRPPQPTATPAAVADELVALITAAGGRTLALFTSWRAHAGRARPPCRSDSPPRCWPRASCPKPALIDAFLDDESASLFATMGFWQGIDVPGRTLSCVVVDRLPFPRPDDPLLQARRDLVGRGQRPSAPSTSPAPPRSWPRAPAGSSARANDRGVVAVLDPRLAKAGYRWDIVRALPPMRRTRHRTEAEAFLRDDHRHPRRRPTAPVSAVPARQRRVGRRPARSPARATSPAPALGQPSTTGGRPRSAPRVPFDAADARPAGSSRPVRW